MGVKGKTKYKGPEWIGKRYGRLTVIREAFMDATGVYKWGLRCDCGNVIESRIGNVVNGHTVSCGCYKTEVISAPRKHGMAGTRLYNIWREMKRRCKTGNSASKHYADRGITICEEWESFVNFENWAINNGYKDDLSIERTDVNGNYCPENCKWINRALQTRNTRKTLWVDRNGKRMSLAEACEQENVPYKTVFARITNLGWTVDKALSVPVNGTRGKQDFYLICPVCKKRFVGHGNNRIYCSKQCKRDVQNSRRRKTRPF